MSHLELLFAESRRWTVFDVYWSEIDRVHDKNNTGYAEKSARGPFQCFKPGLYTNLLNPKTAAFTTSLFAAAMPRNAGFDTGVFCVLTISMISLLWYALVSAIFSCHRAGELYRKFKKGIERISGIIFFIFGAKLVISD